MIDAIGQEIKVGDTIVHCGGKFASANQHKVTGLTPKRVQVTIQRPWRIDKKVGISSFESRTVINITSNLRELEVSNKVKNILDNPREA